MTIESQIETVSGTSPADAALLALLRTAVGAKIAYWEAQSALETALANGLELSDESVDRVGTAVENLAAGADSPDMVGPDELLYVQGLVEAF